MPNLAENIGTASIPPQLQEIVGVLDIDIRDVSASIRSQVIFALQQSGLTTGTSQNPKGTDWIANAFASGVPDPDTPVKERIRFYQRYCHLEGFLLEEDLKRKYNKKYVLVTNSLKSALSVVFNTNHQDAETSSPQDGEIFTSSLENSAGVIAFNDKTLYEKFFKTRNKQGANISQFAALSLLNTNINTYDEFPQLGGKLKAVAKNLGIKDPNPATIIQSIIEKGIINEDIDEIETLEDILAKKNSAQHSIVTNSGESGISTSIETFVPNGGKLLAAGELFGTSKNQLTDVVRENGRTVEFLSLPKTPEDCDVWEDKIKEYKPDALFLESPNNPDSNLAYLPKLCKIAEDNSVRVIIDTTFAPAFVLNIVKKYPNVITVTSTTKYYDGHNGCVGGVVCCNDDQDAEQLRNTRDQQGKNMNPLDTLYFQHTAEGIEERITKQSENAAAVAKKLQKSPFFKNVKYLGLDKNHPQHDLAKEEFTTHEDGNQLFGSMFVFEIDDDFVDVLKTFLDSSGFPFHANLGQKQTMISCPALSTHSRLPKAERLAAGIPDGMVRFSSGVENREKIIEKLSTGLAAACVQKAVQDSSADCVSETVQTSLRTVFFDRLAAGEHQEVIDFIQSDSIKSIIKKLDNPNLSSGVSHLTFWKDYFPSLQQ